VATIEAEGEFIEVGIQMFRGHRSLVGNDKIQIHIRWKAGAVTSIERPLPLTAADLFRTPAEIVEWVRAMATEKTDTQIAEVLNARGLRTGKNNPFTRPIVRHIRCTYGITSYAQHLRGQGWLTAPEMAARMKVNPTTARRFASEGLLRAVHASDNGLFLFEPVTGPVPHAQPGKPFRDRRPYPQLASDMSNEVQYEA
jgi:hypothetical protein